MASKNYIRKRSEELSERNSKRGIYGNEVKRERMMHDAEELQCVGGLVSFGRFGSHVIKFYASNDPTHYWIRSDGKMKAPRTSRGVRSTVSDWCWGMLSSCCGAVDPLEVVDYQI